MPASQTPFEAPLLHGLQCSSAQDTWSALWAGAYDWTASGCDCTLGLNKYRWGMDKMDVYICILYIYQVELIIFGVSIYIYIYTDTYETNFCSCVSKTCKDFGP